MAKTRVWLAASVVCAGAANAAVINVGDSTAPWLGFMNVFELPANGGGYVFGNAWGIGDLRATFDDPNSKLTLWANSIGDPNPFWYIGGGGPGAQGNKVMEANLYQETTGLLHGQTVTFQGIVQTNTFTQAHTAVIFVKDFAPDYSSVVTSIIPLVPGPFSVSLNTINDPARHVQVGFTITGPCVWITDADAAGNAMITTIPTPSGAMLMGLAVIGAARRRRA